MPRNGPHGEKLTLNRPCANFRKQLFCNKIDNHRILYIVKPDVIQYFSFSHGQDGNPKPVPELTRRIVSLFFISSSTYTPGSAGLRRFCFSVVEAGREQLSAFEELHYALLLKNH